MKKAVMLLTLWLAACVSQTLTTGLPVADGVWPYDVSLEWSPDGEHLLVQYGARAWVVPVP